MLEIRKGKINRPLRVVLYGPEGVGKSTLASRFPDPLFIDLEDGTLNLDVARIQGIRDWKGLLSAVYQAASESGICRTLVIDTADRAEDLCARYVCQNHDGKESIEDFGYGKGYTYLAEEFESLLQALDLVIESGIHVVVTAHAKMRKFEQPDELGAYDRWELKLSKQAAPVLKEWSDMLLFLTYKTYVVSDSTGRKKAQGGERVIRTTHHPCWDAKNRQGLADELPLSWDSLAPVFEAAPEKMETAKKEETPKEAGSPEPEAPKKAAPADPDRVTPATLEALYSRLIDEEVSQEELMQVVAQRGKYPEGTLPKEYSERFVKGWILRYWSKVKALVEENRKEAEKKRYPWRQGDAESGEEKVNG